MSQNIYVHSDGRQESIKNGFSWPAFFFGAIWAWTKGMVGVGFALLGLAIILRITPFILVDLLGEAGVYVDFLLSVAVLIWVGLNGNKWRRQSMPQRGYKLESTNEILSHPECASTNDGLAFFFRVAFIYLGASTLASWVLNAILTYSRWTVISSAPGFNKEEFMLKMGIGLISSLFFAWVLWQAREGRSVKLLCVVLGYALLGAVVMVMYSMVYRPSAGETNVLYSTSRWLGVIVSGKGHPIGWVIATLRLLSCPISQSLFGALNFAQQVFTVGLFSFALAKQPERIAASVTC